MCASTIDMFFVHELRNFFGNGLINFICRLQEVNQYGTPYQGFRSYSQLLSLLLLLLLAACVHAIAFVHRETIKKRHLHTVTCVLYNIAKVLLNSIDKYVRERCISVKGAAVWVAEGGCHGAKETWETC